MCEIVCVTCACLCHEIHEGRSKKILCEGCDVMSWRDEVAEAHQDTRRSRPTKKYFWSCEIKNLIDVVDLVRA